MNRHSHNVFNDYHTSKLNFARWFRVNENMRDPLEISNNIRGGYEFLFECLGDYYEEGYYMKYFITVHYHNLTITKFYSFF